MMIVTISRLNKYCAVRQTFSVNFATNIIQMNTYNCLLMTTKFNNQNIILPFPICLLVFSMVEFLLTLDKRPRQNLLLLLFGGFVNPSIIME